MVIYWSYIDINEGTSVINVTAPTPLISQISTLHNTLSEETKNNFNNAFNRCPAAIEFCKNKFVLKSPYNFTLGYGNDDKNEPVLKIKTKNQLDDNFVPRNFTVRDIKTGFFSFNAISYVFFSEEDVEMELQPVHFDRSDFVKYTTIIPGKFNVGKWFRNIECPFFMNMFNTYFEVTDKDNLVCVSFNTDKKIELKRFYFTDKHEKFLNNTVYYKNLSSIPFKNYFNELYKKFNQSKIKKLILKEIKENLME